MSPGGADASFGGLPSDVWVHILQYLAHNDLPKPLSGWCKQTAMGEPDEIKARLPLREEAGMTLRSHIRAPELASLMSTCVNFNLIAAPLLYRRIITDSLGDLTVNLLHPRAKRSIASKQELLNITEYLHLEHRQHGDEPRYVDLMMDTRYWGCVVPRPWEQSTPMEFAVEAERTLSALRLLLASKPLHHSTLPPPPPFPKLKTLTICALFGPQARYWDYAVMNNFLRQDVLDQSWLFMDKIFSLSPLVDICTRLGAGPYCLPAVVNWSQISKRQPSLKPPTLVIHLRCTDKYTPIAIGNKTRWILEQHERTIPINTPQKVIETTTEAIIKAIWQRNDKAVGPLKDKTVKLEVYSSMEATGKDERKAMMGARDFLAGRRKVLDTHKAWARMEGDVVDWYAGIDAPPCQACGGFYDKDPQSRWA